jgi:hypothetical protein
MLVLVLTVSFAALIPAIHRWGATDAEVARALPGDELLPRPALIWTNGIDIDAPPAQVWPWVAQLGDTRGGFYSYTFIENRVAALTGASGYSVVYRNADRVVPEWQHPAPGDPLIQGTLNVRAVQPGVWLLADTTPPAAFGWTWLWRLDPLDGGARTRLVNRMRIQVGEAPPNLVAGSVMDLGGFVMQQRMMQGIKLRAEGGHEPAWMEGAEIGLWLTALLSGLIAAWLFVVQPAWPRPLAVGVASVVVLLILTFVQPPTGVRAVLDAALIGGAWWAYRAARPAQAGAPRAAAASPPA